MAKVESGESEGDCMRFVEKLFKAFSEACEDSEGDSIRDIYEAKCGEKELDIVGASEADAMYREVCNAIGEKIEAGELSPEDAESYANGILAKFKEACDKSGDDDFVANFTELLA